ncbi:MAG TPA: hypothetical protein VLQ78_10995 [Ornithinibacter sp.]|nr:hypothetical protein [Ornithinibacter sp.]
MNEQQITALLREEWDTTQVGPAPVDAVMVSPTGPSRPRLLAGAGVGLAAAVTLAAVLVAGGDDPRTVEPAGPDLARQTNPLDIAWYDGDVLHLRAVGVPMDLVLDVAPVADGRTYGAVISRLVDDVVEVVHVDASGEQTVIGTIGEDADVVGSSQETVVAWAAGSGRDREVVAYDTATARELGRTPLPADSPGATPVAVDDGAVFLADPRGTQVWVPGEGAPSPYDAGEGLLLDVAAGLHLVAAPDLRTVSFGPVGAGRSLPGAGGPTGLSDDGSYVLPGSGLGVGTVRAAEFPVHRTGDGEIVSLDLDPETPVLDAALGTDSVTYVVGRDFVVPEGLDDPAGYQVFELLTCDLASGACDTAVADVGSDPSPRSPVVLAR